MSESRRSTRIAALPKKDEPVQPAKPARKPSNKRVSDAGKDASADAPAAKKVCDCYSRNSPYFGMPTTQSNFRHKIYADLHAL